jgi:hypothetical protein
MANMTSLARQLDQTFRTAVHDVRDTLSSQNIGDFELTMHACGRTMTDADSVKIEYRIGGRYSDDSVRGNDLYKVLVEYMRRKGWNDTNAPLALAAPAEAVAEEC